MKIIVFLQGTIIMPKSGVNKTRKERVRDSIEQGGQIRDFASYMPINNASEKLHKWVKQGAEIIYLSALTENKKARGDEILSKKDLKIDQEILNKYGFPEGEIYHREDGESYADIAGRVMPDILIEDDCESIGAEEITYPHIKQDIRKKIKSILVREFGGIDHLSDHVNDLANHK